MSSAQKGAFYGLFQRQAICFAKDTKIRAMARHKRALRTPARARANRLFARGNVRHGTDKAKSAWLSQRRLGRGRGTTKNVVVVACRLSEE